MTKQIHHRKAYMCTLLDDFKSNLKNINFNEEFTYHFGHSAYSSSVSVLYKKTEYRNKLSDPNEIRMSDPVN